ncbi:uncharacterized protein EMH_0012180 [Eimeria mitis]|uniref:Uncharacterized protein n=1 Tax=Eimeria mitis TaxID=44415 RepID=U6K3R5_9EIME|nr:uncharacterized protein EMH_0012180 [Eimeria mitis]CDJ32355.1 hypothetical protein, conserved [Eimeria mitis]
MMKRPPMATAANLFLLLLLSFTAAQIAAAAQQEQQQQQPITFGSAIALVHEASGHKLYSGKISWGSASAGQAVVSASSGSEGPESVFIVECANEKDVWRAGAPVKLKNLLLGSALQASKQHVFSYNNCGRGCPIASHLEVSVLKDDSELTTAAPDKTKATAVSGFAFVVLKAKDTAASLPQEELTSFILV